MALVQMNVMNYRPYFLKIQNLVQYSEQFELPVITQPFTFWSQIMGVNLKVAHQLPTDQARLQGKMKKIREKYNYLHKFRLSLLLLLSHLKLMVLSPTVV